MKKIKYISPREGSRLTLIKDIYENIKLIESRLLFKDLKGSVRKSLKMQLKQIKFILKNLENDKWREHYDLLK